MINKDDYSYIKEKEGFLSDKCGYCMRYLTEGKCQNNFCESKIFEL